jgi:glycerate-2-kinase
LSPDLRRAFGPATERRRLLDAARSIVRAGLLAADPGRMVAEQLAIEDGVLHVAGVRHRLGSGRVVLVAAGKAAATMSAAAEAVLGPHLDAGLAVDVRKVRLVRRVRLLVARHPLPDERGLRASEAVEALAGGSGRPIC